MSNEDLWEMRRLARLTCDECELGVWPPTMTGIQQITTQAEAGSEQTSHSIGNLSRLAQDLDKSVTGFKLPH